jgi:hypothetical protein
MKPLAQIAHLLSTDATFRQAFLENPEKAIAARGLALEVDLAGAQGLLGLSPRDLAERITGYTNYYGSWGGFTLENPAPAPLLS